jgi:hypothetical protein
MKPFHEVQKARQARSESNQGPAVYRSSLMAPRMDRAATQVSFLNHFLLKRGIEAVTCKVSAIDAVGRLVGVDTVAVNAPVVYAIDLETVFPGCDEARQYNIEFYSSDDLVVPYPAAMINHWGDDFVNTVHSYNRVLNDVFEDEKVNQVRVLEASVDGINSGAYTTFFNYATGPIEAPGEVELVRLSEGGVVGTARLAPPPGKLACVTSCLSQIQPEFDRSSVIKIAQPYQKLFYGRMLAGRLDQRTGAFSANHTYYDCSDVEEYFDNDVSARVYPYFSGFLNEVVVYPIMSPGDYRVQVDVFAGAGAHSSRRLPLSSPSGNPVLVCVDALVEEAGLSDCAAFQVVVRAADGGRIPTRVMHQLVYGDAARRSQLNSSVAVGLINRSTVQPAGKRGICWGQMVLRGDYDSRLGVCFDTADGEPAEVCVEFYGARGLFHELHATLRPGGALTFSADALPDPGDGAGHVWYMARSSRADLSAQSFHVHKASGNASGEHSF